MRHLDHLCHRFDQLFARPPGEIDPHVVAPQLGLSLGATLYTPATTNDLPDRLQRLRRSGVVSSVLCLEDSVAEPDVDAATANVSAALHAVIEEGLDVPLCLLRLRTPASVGPMLDRLKDRHCALSGLILPKFGAQSGSIWLDELDRHGVDLPVMPVLEDTSVLRLDTRVATLETIRALLDSRPNHVLGVRFGATDLSGLLGLRRSAEQTVYDLLPIADCLASVINVFGREPSVCIAGPVWEHYATGESLWKPQLRESLFPVGARGLRHELIATGLAHLVREARLDLANGLMGKSVIHPEHVPIVDACHVVTAEEHRDALDILSGRDGAWASPSANKMNEARPHRRWAERVVVRGEHFGVLRDDITLVDVLVEAGT